MGRFKFILFIGAFISMGSAPVFAAAPSSVECSALAVTIVFDGAVTGSTIDVTKVGLSSASAGPFTALSRDSIAEVEDNRTITVLLTHDDAITHDPITQGTCYVEVQSGFVREVTATTSRQG
jgi:hypothetical protein